MTVVQPCADVDALDIRALTAMQPFLVLAPHPDDESLGCGGLIAGGCRYHLDPVIVVLTDGGASHSAPGWSRKRLAATRALEADCAAHSLGVPADRFFHLGASDGALDDDHRVAGQLRAILKITGARRVFVTDPLDSHPDHRAAFRLAVQMVAEGLIDSLFTYPISQRFEGGDTGRFLKLPLVAADRARKAEAIACHRTQLGERLPTDSGFMLAAPYRAMFEEAAELYRPLHGLSLCLAPDAPAHFDNLFASDADPWDYETSAYEKARHTATIKAVAGESVMRAWEAGAAAGVLSEQLLAYCDHLVITDASSRALAHARARLGTRAEIYCMTLPESVPDGPFDLILLSDMLYYLGLDGVIRTAALCRARLAPGGRIIVVSWLGDTEAALTGQESAEAFAACVSCSLTLVHHETAPGFRLDVYQDVLACTPD